MNKSTALAVCAVAVAFAVGAGAPAASANTSAGEFLKSVVASTGKGQYGRVWDRLHPAQQRFISRDRLIDCYERGDVPSFTIKRWKVLATYQEKKRIPGTNVRARTTAVTVRYTIDIDGRPDATGTETLHAVLVSGRWRSMADAEAMQRFKRGKCWL
jgi:hypothetical protein